VALQETPEPAPEVDEPPPKKRRGAMGIILGVVVVVVLIGVLGLGAVVVGGAAVWVVAQPDAVPTVASAGGEDEGDGSDEASTAAAEPEVDLPDGGKVLGEDRRGDDAPRSKKTTLALKGDDAALVTVAGTFGVKAEWDGKGTFDMGALPEGRYRSFVTPVSTGKKIRNKSFEVEAGKTCAFTFDVGAEDWKGGCK